MQIASCLVVTVPWDGVSKGLSISPLPHNHGWVLEPHTDLCHVWGWSLELPSTSIQGGSHTQKSFSCLHFLEGSYFKIQTGKIFTNLVYDEFMLLLLFSGQGMSNCFATPRTVACQTRILEWVAISFFRGSSLTQGWSHIPCIGKQILYHWATREAQWVHASDDLVLNSWSRILHWCLLLCLL